MRYEVVWETPACFEQIDELTEAGIPVAPLKEVVHWIAAELQTDPNNKGKALSEGLRRLDLPPFHVYFFVDEANERVTVTVLYWKQ